MNFKVTTKSPLHGTPEPSALKFRLSRDYFKLQGFSETGGVLIGSTSDSCAREKTGFVDFRWETEGPRLRLILVERDGRIVRSQPYQVSLIRQALAYAADGRPVAVTIIPRLPCLISKCSSTRCSWTRCWAVG